jgi:aspartokinase
MLQIFANCDYINRRWRHLKMAESVSSCVKRIIDKTPFIHEMLVRGILSFSNYASSIKEEVEENYGKSVKHSAIVMAIRRYGEELKTRENSEKKVNVDYEIVMKTKICDLNIVRNDKFLSKLTKLYHEVSTEKGDFLNVSLGSHEISVAVSEKYGDVVDEISLGEEILHRKDDLVALSLVFSGEFMATPGIVYEAVRKLAWEVINVIEIISTKNELTFVINRTDSMKAFDVLQSFLV